MSIKIKQILANTGLGRYAHRAYQKAFDIIPEKVCKNPTTERNIKWIGDNITSPENRAILGVTALMSQPFIDMANKDVDQKTRNVSVARTIAKIIAGTLTGVMVRRGCIYTVQKLSMHKSPHKINQILTPSVLDDYTPQRYKNYQNALGTFLGLVAMLFTNFLIDAPLTKYLTNKFTPQLDKRSEMRGDK